MSLLAQASRLGLRRLVSSTARPLTQANSSRVFAAEAAPKAGGGDDDVVIDTFKESQKQYREFMKGLKNIDLPTSDDANAIKKYASDMEGLKKKLGIPGVDEILDATLEHKLATAQWDVRKFLAHATEDVDVDEAADVLAELEKAVDEVEDQTGQRLDANNEEGWRLIGTKAKDIAAKHGLDNVTKIREQAITDMYKEQLVELRRKAAEEMEAAKRKDHLEWVQVDPKEIKPKIEA
ncbi:hypothetical protein WJX72_005484 [[Myrmecia] bisecta]|uniref:ATP synthase subunit d, mitochondrial n=1 Tax=[Myrmecia] bisecta TaxID=41462 RepID=A0AAW1PRW5_9CHLO